MLLPSIPQIENVRPVQPVSPPLWKYEFWFTYKTGKRMSFKTWATSVSEARHYFERAEPLDYKRCKARTAWFIIETRYSQKKGWINIKHKF